MEKPLMHSKDMVASNIEAIAALFPNCVTERKDANGKVTRGIDFEKLQQELSNDIIERGEERYQFTWPGKMAAIREANTPTNSALRPDVDGSEDFWNTKNLYIEGDNLEVLKLLQEDYLGKVKMIYIDPPYNTGKEFVYNDDFTEIIGDYTVKSGMFDDVGNLLLQNYQKNAETDGRFHTKWLNMMYMRLKVARNLLANDGVIFMSIDDHEVENLKKISNEIFGEKNFIGQWNWYKSATPPNLSKKIKKNIEYVLAYQKGENTDIFRGIKKTSSSNDPMTKPQNSLKELTFKAGTLNTKCKDGVYPIGVYGTDKFPNELMNEMIIKNGINANDVVFKNRFIWVQDTLNENIANGTRFELSKQLVISYKKAEYGAEVPPNFIDDSVNVDTTEKAGTYVSSLFENNTVFDYPKPVSLIKYLTNFFIKSKEESIIMDFFSGSGTTAEAIMALNAEDGGNRRIVLVQLPEDLDENIKNCTPTEKQILTNAISLCDSLKAPHLLTEVAKERLRRAGKKIKEESPLTTQHLDTGFRVLKLADSNMKQVYYTPTDTKQQMEIDLFDTASNIKEDRTGLDLLFQVMLEKDVTLDAPIRKEEIMGHDVYFVDDTYLVAAFGEKLPEELIKELAKMQPFNFVMANRGLADDSMADNFEQIFKAYSPDTNCMIL